MKQIREELLSRLHKHREKKHSFVNLIVKLILIILLISMIRFFGDEKESKFRNVFKSFSKKNKVEIIK